MDKPRIFIGSASEHLDVAYALQANLDFQAETTVWKQGIFKPGKYPIESLLEALHDTDIAVFVFSPEDITNLRGKHVRTVRDNVIFELGLFMGVLQKERSLILVPRRIDGSHIPSDLTGLTTLEYDSNRSDGRLTAALGPAANSLINDVLPMVTTGQVRPTEARLFSQFDDVFSTLLRRATNEIVLYFIHSRRWRETHNEQLVEFLQRGGELRVFLPDLNNRILLKNLRDHFDDGGSLNEFIKDSYRYFGSLRSTFKRRIVITKYSIYPTYSFYLFDSTDAIVAMYPTTSEKKSVPAFRVRPGDQFWEFLNRDIARLKSECKRVTITELESITQKRYA